MSLTNYMNEYRSLELDAHVSLDDVILKAIQESYELIDAISEEDHLNIQKEAGDLLVNLLSVTAYLWDISILDTANIIPGKKENISNMMAIWSRDVSARRKRYSRDTFSEDAYKKNLTSLVSLLLSLSGKSDMSSVMLDSIGKFRSRIAAYLPELCLEDYIDAYPDFPKPGILFRDIAPLLADPDALRYAGFELAKKSRDADIIVGLDARGFIFGTLVAQILEKPFVMIRKKGKLPWETIGTGYSLEYGDNSIEIQKDAIRAGERVVIIDDLLATGGTFLAAAALVEKVGGTVEKLVALISLDEEGLISHPSREAISAYRCESVLHYL